MEENNMTLEERHQLFETALREGLEESRRQWPEAPSARHAAFANTYAYAMTGLTGGHGGPSLREIYACAFARPPMSKAEARAIAARVHDELSRQQLRALRQVGPTFDDDPDDLRKLGESV